MPDISTPNGLLDVIALGNFVQMQHLMNRKYYRGDMSHEEGREDLMTRLAFLIAIRSYSQQWAVSIKGRLVPFNALVDRSFIIFAAGIVRLKRKLHASYPVVEGCSYPRFLKEVSNHIKEHFVWLEDRYHSLRKCDDGSFMWTHPDITVRKGRPNGRESLEFLEQVMFGESDDDSEGKSSIISMCTPFN
jgi:hypothetical protein